MRLDDLAIHALALFGLLLLLITCSEDAAAHDAPRGWTYPLSCCSDFDCREVPDDWIEEGPDGYRVVITGEIIPMSSPKVRHSPDGVFHWCSVAGAIDGRTICLFVPPRGF